MKKSVLEDQKTPVEILKKKVQEFCSARDWDAPHNPKDLAVGVVTEASELLEIFRFCSEGESLEMLQSSEIREKVGRELADSLCFILRFAQLYHFDLTSCLKDKLSKNALKYPLSQSPSKGK